MPYEKKKINFFERFHIIDILINYYYFYFIFVSIKRFFLTIFKFYFGNHLSADVENIACDVVKLFRLVVITFTGRRSIFTTLKIFKNFWVIVSFSLHQGIPIVHMNQIDVCIVRDQNFHRFQISCHYGIVQWRVQFSCRNVYLRGKEAQQKSENHRPVVPCSDVKWGLRQRKIEIKTVRKVCFKELASFVVTSDD